LIELFNYFFEKGTIMKTYICIVCGFVYDEAQGRPEEGIAAGTLWSAVPDDWACPDCGVAKVDFEVVEI
jgi:rubredoxin